MLTLIYGTAKCGKTTKSLNIARAHASKAEPCILIVPEQYSVTYESLVCNAADTLESTAPNTASAQYIDILSFERLINQTISNYRPNITPAPNASMRDMLIQKAIFKCAGKLNFFNGAINTLGFSSQISSLFDEFERYMLDPIEICNNNHTHAMQLKLDDIALIYNTYQTMLTNKFPNMQDTHATFLQLATTYNLFSNTHFILDQFTSFTPAEMQIISFLTKHAKSVDVTLTLDNPYAPTPTTHSNADILHGLDVFATTRATFEQLQGLERDCKTLALPPRATNLNTTYFAAESMTDEIESVAKVIVNRVRKFNANPSDFAILSNEPAYAPIIAERFKKYDIPIHINQEKNVLSLPITQLFFKILQVFAYNFNHSSTFSYLKCAPNITSKTLYKLENYALAAPITQAQWLGEQPLKFVPMGFEPTDIELLNNFLQQEISPIFAEFKSHFSGRKKAKDIIKAIVSWQNAVKIKQFVATSAQNLNNNAQTQQAREWVAGYKALISTLSDIQSVFADDNFTIKQFITMLKQGLANTKLDLPPNTQNSAEYCDIARFKGDAPKYVFIVGSIDGIFPKRYVSEGIISDSERESLSNLGIALADSTSTKQVTELLTIYRCLNSASHQVIISAPMQNQQSEDVTPSFVFNRAKKVAQPIDIPQFESANATFNMAARYLKDKNHIKDSTIKSIQNWYTKHMPQAMAEAKQFANYSTKAVGESKVLSQLYNKNNISVSRVEAYNKCQFAYFASYGLKAYPRRKFNLSAPDTGSIIHEVLERYCKTVTRWEDIKVDNLRARVADIVLDVLTKYCAKSVIESPRFSSVVAKITNTMQTCLWNIVQYYQQSGFKPIAFEFAFGGKSQSLPPISLTLEDGKKVDIIGKIDRVDAREIETNNAGKVKEIMVVDYKGSDHSIDYDEVVDGVSVQLPTYLHALCGEFTHYKPAGCMYYLYYKAEGAFGERLTSDDYIQINKQLRMQGLMLDYGDRTTVLSRDWAVVSSNRTASADELTQLCEAAVKSVKNTLAKMYKGENYIRPYKFKNNTTQCKWCEYKSVCKKK
ncbi:MAG: PD-(D/E)XK nuclease family protein [Clostridiales bacterium]|jgi:ATP-dependent helicase/nuclease subunit B|nr:PD-(D/E)XK nuclease family protein [Clostridiales bacterium]